MALFTEVQIQSGVVYRSSGWCCLQKFRVALFTEVQGDVVYRSSGWRCLQKFRLRVALFTEAQSDVVYRTRTVLRILSKLQNINSLCFGRIIFFVLKIVELP